MERTGITYEQIVKEFKKIGAWNNHLLVKINDIDHVYVHNTSIYTVSENVVFFGDCIIGPFCIIGSHCEIKGKESYLQGVRIGHNVKIHGHCTIDSGSERPTLIGYDNYLMKFTHIGHDVQTGKSCTFSPGAKIGGHAVIGDYVTVGMNACVHQNIYIPDGVMIGMNASMVKKEYQPYRKYVANGKDIGFNKIAYTKYGKETA